MRFVSSNLLLSAEHFLFFSFPLTCQQRQGRNAALSLLLCSLSSLVLLDKMMMGPYLLRSGEI
jgi:hypothetical protein